MAGPVQPAASRGGRWWIAPAVVVGLVLLAWLVMSGMPFGRDEEKPRATATATETIAEGPADPPQSATLIEVPPGEADDSFEITTSTAQEPPMMAPAPNTTTAAPPGTATTPPPATTTTRTAPPVQRQPVQRPPVVAQQPRPTPAPARVVPRAAPSEEITGEEAVATLRNYVRGRRYYPVASECIRVENRGYRNVGYTLEVWHSCAGGGASRLLGRWRVDSKTREVFRQQDDGRYQRP
jgi:cytoskeletal protein RodZ